MNRNSGSFNRPRSYYLGALALLLVGVVLGLGISARLDLQPASNAQRNAGFQLAQNATASPPESPFVSVVEKALPAVVFVDVKKKVSGDDSSDPQDEIFKRLFGDTPHRGPTIRPSSGSGFIIDPKGYVLTNNHVVRDASDITVTLEDKRTFKAKIVGTDAETDVAVIKIEGDHLPAVPLGDSDRIRVGDWAIAIGNPLGVLRGSVTVGVISARGRSGLDIFGGTPQFQDFIQTDASINFGNSGGPLCNIRGEAIGINTAINPNGQGIGFAIPINLAKHVADQLIAHGSVKRAMLGVMLAELTPEIAEGFGLASTDGVLIERVFPGSPADRAGIKRNDVVVEFDGQSVTDREKFRLKVADTPAGRRVPITVLRDGKRVSLTVGLTDRDEKVLAQNANPQSQATLPQAQALGGLVVRELTSEEKSNLGIASGVMVTQVKEGSAAEEAGIQPSDVIEEVGGKVVTSGPVLTKMLRDAKMAKKQHAVLLVWRDSQTQFVPLSLE
jgi:serine protease Do